jgi:hypothetical protein
VPEARRSLPSQLEIFSSISVKLSDLGKMLGALSEEKLAVTKLGISRSISVKLSDFGKVLGAWSEEKFAVPTRNFQVNFRQAVRLWEDVGCLEREESFRPQLEISRSIKTRGQVVPSILYPVAGGKDEAGGVGGSKVIRAVLLRIYLQLGSWVMGVVFILWFSVSGPGIVLILCSSCGFLSVVWDCPLVSEGGYPVSGDCS